MTPLHQLLVRAACGPSEEARNAWLRWCDEVDFDALDPVSERFVPLVVGRTGVVRPDDPLSGRARGLYRRAWAANEVLWHDVEPVLDALGPHVLLGGSLVARQTRSRGRVRPLLHLDVVVPAPPPNGRSLVGAAGHLVQVHVSHRAVVEDPCTSVLLLLDSPPEPEPIHVTDLHALLIACPDPSALADRARSWGLLGVTTTAVRQVHALSNDARLTPLMHALRWRRRLFVGLRGRIMQHAS